MPQPQDNFDVSIVIPTYNAANSIGMQLAALAKQDTNLRYEVIVVNNCSTDNLDETIQNYQHLFDYDGRDLRLVNASEKAGVNYARNVGIKNSRSEQILICDADDIVATNFVAELHNCLNTNDLVGGGLVPWTGELPLPPHENILIFNQPKLNYLPVIPGCCFGLHKRAAEAIGYFDESFMGGCDEAELSWRIQQKGFTIGFTSKTFIYYRLRHGSSQIIKQHYRYGLMESHLSKVFGIENLTGRDWLLKEYRRVRHLLGQAIHNPKLIHDRNWCEKVGLTIGRWRGSIRERTWTP
ncbi:glycosyltransferase [Actinomyces vulturis]|uniref:glycosyltransferase n=1 Tax=Actinomyces vulturis TaxID=1857645 RepID=UPI0009F2E8FA|nr:glycosyltransferase [Actinomyces vulturis]